MPDASESARESICVVDDRTADRVIRAGKRHLARSPRTRGVVLTWTLVFAGMPLVFTGFDQGWAVAARTAVLMLPVGLVLAVVLVRYSVGRNLRTLVHKEYRPGRMLGLTVGSHSVRVRDHNSSHEVTYAAVEAVEQHGDVVVLALGERFWLLPIELFDPVTLAALRARVERRAAGGLRTG